MKVSGSATLHAGRDEVWAALTNPAVLVRTIPGCQRLEAIGPDAYAMTLTAGVASIKGVYEGQVRLTDQQPPDAFILRAAGSGAPGTVSADVHVTLTAAGAGGTHLAYDADAIVGGMIGGVGQRMLTGVAKKTAGEFFAAVEEAINHREPDIVATGPALVQSDASSQGPARTVFEAPGAAQALANAGDRGGFVKGAIFGAAVALLGVLVGGWAAGRRRG
ncbi:MAG: SRPBCC family protein [Nocardioidaceae bacterium]